MNSRGRKQRATGLLGPYSLYVDLSSERYVESSWSPADILTT